MGGKPCRCLGPGAKLCLARTSPGILSDHDSIPMIHSLMMRDTRLKIYVKPALGRGEVASVLGFFAFDVGVPMPCNHAEVRFRPQGWQTSRSWPVQPLPGMHLPCTQCAHARCGRACPQAQPLQALPHASALDAAPAWACSALMAGTGAVVLTLATVAALLLAFLPCRVGVPVWRDFADLSC